MKAYGATDIGNIREENQDSFLVDEDLGLFIVADGMGGHRGGGVASSVAVSVLRGHIEANRGRKDKIKVVKEAFSSANKAIIDKALEDPDFLGMGTTATMAWIVGNEMIIAHVGDSRAYLYRNGRLIRITKDHSLLQELIDKGRADVKANAVRNVITKALGAFEEISPDIIVDRFEPTDALLLCTDGLNLHLTDEKIEGTICMEGDKPDKAVNSLLKMAKAEGGKDNITAILVVGDHFRTSPFVTPAVLKARRIWSGKGIGILAMLLALLLIFLFVLGGRHLTFSSRGGELVICRSLIIPGTRWVVERTGLPSSWADLVFRDWRRMDLGRRGDARRYVARIFVEVVRRKPEKVKRIWMEKGISYVEMVGIDRIGLSRAEIADFFLDLGDLFLSVEAWGSAFSSYSRSLAYSSENEELVERAIRGMVESNLRAGVLGEYIELLRRRLASNPKDDLARRILKIGYEIKGKR